MIGEIGNQVADIARTNGKIAATEAANEKMKTAGSDARNAAISQLKKDGKEVTDQAIHDQMYQTFYNEAFNQSGMGTGQSTQRAITAATAAIQALAGGDIKAAIAGGAAPYIANAIANAIPEKDLKGRVLAHAVVNAALAAASGRDAASAAAGAAVGELAGKIAVDGFGKQVSELSEEEKQTVSALATLASGLAGGLVGDSSTNAVAAAQAGKTTVENNLMGGGTEDGQVKAAQEHAKNIMSCSTAPGSASCQKGLAMQDALMVALPAGLGGGLLAAATPELAAAAQAVLAGCQSAAILCLNQAGILTAEVATPGGVGAAGIVTVGKNAAEIAAAKAEVTAASSAKPGWLQNVQAGNKFNAEQSKNYPYNELYVNKPNGNGYYRVDSYNPATGEIVSRKFTQFSDITESTATNYIREAVNKYPAGATIAKVPSSGSLGGDALRGTNILEVPPQVKPIPQSVLNAADKAGVVIRDTNGKVYQ